jgi:hypothetical protein
VADDIVKMLTTASELIRRFEDGTKGSLYADAADEILWLRAELEVERTDNNLLTLEIGRLRVELENCKAELANCKAHLLDWR